MEPSTNNNNQKNQSEFSLKDLILSFRSLRRYWRVRWITIAIYAIVGASLGLCYSLIKKPVYTATLTFSLEDDDQSGGISSIVASFGLDVGNDKSSLFEGDNLLLFFQSRLMVQKTLMSEEMFENRKELLVNRYIEGNKLRRNWGKNPLLKNLSFTAGQQVFSRLQDSVLKTFYKDILKRNLDLKRPDKKLSVIAVTYKGKDELFAKIFIEKLTSNVVDFYTKSKTIKSEHDINILQHQTDSVRLVLNSSLSSVAQTADNAPNANPLKLILKVPSQKEQVNVEASEAELTELVKNLELDKITMRKQTPLIAYIDLPILPLDNDRVSKVNGSIIGMLLGTFIALMILTLKRMYKSVMA